MVDFNSEKQLLDFLEKNYFIKENKYFSRHEDIHIWGKKIAEEIALIFSYSTDFCFPIFKLWVTSKGLNEEQYDAAWSNSLFSAELIQDLQGYHGIDAIAETERELVDGMTTNINQQIIRNIFSLSGTTTIHLRGE